MRTTDFSAFDRLMMRRCLIIAERGRGLVEPNPIVGCVIVRDGNIVGEGWHECFGGPHAEIEALLRAGASAHGATLYVNLEPCNHFGKTPPCTKRIIEAGISTVIIGMLDPNPLVNGKGLRTLLDAGIATQIGIMEDACLQVNSQFTVNTGEQRAYAIVKIAQSLNGFISAAPQTKTDITCRMSNRKVHRLRSRVDAVLIGANTLRTDDPMLTTRFVEGRNPKRLILTASWNLPPHARVFRNDPRSTYIVSSADAVRKHKTKAEAFVRLGVNIIALDADVGRIVPPREVLAALYQQGIFSVLIEGGSQIFTQFITAGSCDELHVFSAPAIFLRGEPSLLPSTDMDTKYRFLLDRTMKSGTDVYSIFHRMRS